MSQKTLHMLDWDGTGKFAARIVRDSETREYVVMFYKNDVHYEPADYYTTDKKDALGTAFLELERMSKKG